MEEELHSTARRLSRSISSEHRPSGREGGVKKKLFRMRFIVKDPPTLPILYFHLQQGQVILLIFPA